MKICYLYQKCLSWYMAMDMNLPARVARHLETCPECHRLCQLQAQLTRRLTEGALDHRSTPSPFLHSRIMASLEISERRDQTVPTSHWLPKYGFQLGAVAAAITVIFVVISQIGQQTNTATDSSSDPATFADAGPLLKSWAAKIEQADGQKLFSLEQPLDKELQGLTQDAKSALTYLAHNFLPEGQLQ
jgi:hypothetical protein